MRAGTAAGRAGTGRAAPAGRPDVSLVVQQLRRAVPGGIGTYCTGLLAGLAALGQGGAALPALELVASATRARPDPLRAWGVPVRAVPVPGPLLTRLWDAGIDAGTRGAVVHALSLASPPARGRALVVTVHDLAWLDVPQAFPARGRRWHQAALDRAVARASRLVVPSAAVADAVVGAGAAAGRVVVVEHGSDHLPPADDRGAGELLARLGVAGPFVLAVGTLEPRKNLARLTEAHRRAQARLGERMPLVVVGPRGWGDGAPAAGAPAAEAVAAGPVPAAVLAGLYRRARLLAYVPLAEGFGLPPLEAMAAGTPVVCSAVPSAGGAALQVDPTDVDAIAGALVEVATDDATRRDLVAAGYRRAAARTWRASAAEHVALWQALR